MFLMLTKFALLTFHIPSSNLFSTETTKKESVVDDQAVKKPKYFYFVGEKKYESDDATITGAQIKARIVDLEPGTGLSLEGHGNDPDQMIGDADTVSLEIGHGHGPLHFTLVPPATFG